jgi:hypothetical protein
MQKHHYNLTIEAKTEAEADAKISALTTLASKLSAWELTKLAHVLKHDPVKTALAKKYLGV